MKIIKLSIIFVLFMISSSILVFSQSTSELTLGTVDKTEESLIDDISYQYYELTDSSGLKQKIYYASFDPINSKYEMVLHHVSNDTNRFVSANVMTIAKDYESKTNKKVIAAVNGDYFIGSTPVDYYVNNGEIINVGPYNWKNSFGFNNDGETTIGRINQIGYKIKLTVNKEIHEFEIDKINEEPGVGEIAIFTPNRFTSVSYLNTAKYLMNLDTNRSSDYTYPIGGTAYRITKGDITSDKPVSLSIGKLVIAIKGDNEISRFFYDNYNYGNRIEIVQIPKGDYQNMDWVIGGYSILVNNEVLLPNGAHADNGGDSLAPRTSIGITKDGKFFITVIDGRQANFSQGITVSQQGQLVYDLGAKTALELDGGGSSTFLIRQGDELVLVNKPSDGQMRAVSNAVLIVEKEPGTYQVPTPGDDEQDPPSDDEDTTPPNEDDGEPIDNNPSPIEDEPKIYDKKSKYTTYYIVVPIGIIVVGAISFLLIKRKH